MAYVSGATIRKTYDVCNTSLRSWADQGKIRVVRTSEGSGKRLYCLEDVRAHLGVSNEAIARRGICYGRVSSHAQQADLERQCAELQRARPQHELVRDTGSGLNWQRPGLQTLLDAVCGGGVQEVVVTHRDRLARVAVELLEWLFRRYDTKFVVLNKDDDPIESANDELRDDLLAVVTFFVARNNGRRSAANRRRRASAAQEEQDQEGRPNTKRWQGPQDPGVPDRRAEGETSSVVRHRALDVQSMPGSGEGRSDEDDQEGTAHGGGQQRELRD